MYIFKKIMKKLFKFEYYFLIFLLSSCSTKSNLNNNIGEICNSKLYDGNYNLRLERKCPGDPKHDYNFGRAKLNIDKCNLSINSLENAYFDTKQKLEDWKSLNAKIDLDGDVRGEMFLRTLYGKEEFKYIVFSGTMNDFRFKSLNHSCNFTFKLEKTEISLNQSSIENEEDIIKPPTIIIPTGVLGTIDEIQKMILEKTLESKIDDYFSIVPKDLFEQAQEKAFEELEYEECTEEQCIVKIQELLQVENAFKLLLIRDNNDTQISLTWNNLDEKRVEEVYCENCNTKRLRESIEGIVEKLISNNL